jgi:hypothetical protein
MDAVVTTIMAADIVQVGDDIMRVRICREDGGIDIGLPAPGTMVSIPGDSRCTYRDGRIEMPDGTTITCLRSIIPSGKAALSGSDEPVSHEEFRGMVAIADRISINGVEVVTTDIDPADHTVRCTTRDPGMGTIPIPDDTLLMSRACYAGDIEMIDGTVIALYRRMDPQDPPGIRSGPSAIPHTWR